MTGHDRGSRGNMTGQKVDIGHRPLLSDTVGSSGSLIVHCRVEVRVIKDHCVSRLSHHQKCSHIRWSYQVGSGQVKGAEKGAEKGSHLQV